MMHFELPKTFHKTPIALDLSVVVGQYKGFWGWARIGWDILGDGGRARGEIHTLLLQDKGRDFNPPPLELMQSLAINENHARHISGIGRY